MKKFILIIGCIALLSTTATSFDGKRSGFILGGGIGLAPSASIALKGSPKQLTNSSGLGINFKLGNGSNEYNTIAFEFNFVVFKNKSFDKTIIQGFNGLTWNHYYDELGDSFFTTLGMGFYTFDFLGSGTNKMSLAMLIGAGYEYRKNWSLGLYYSIGKTTHLPAKFRHDHFNILVTGLLF